MRNVFNAQNCQASFTDRLYSCLFSFQASSINIDEPMFQPFPSEMFFQNFVPFETYEIPLTLRNNDQVPRLVKVTQQDSPYFKIISPSNVGHKVGPGLPTTFVLQFTPEDKKVNV